jgi:hypothetical protein
VSRKRAFLLSVRTEKDSEFIDICELTDASAGSAGTPARGSRLRFLSAPVGISDIFGCGHLTKHDPCSQGTRSSALDEISRALRRHGGGWLGSAKLWREPRRGERLRGGGKNSERSETEHPADQLCVRMNFRERGPAIEPAVCNSLTLAVRCS